MLGRPSGNHRAGFMVGLAPIDLPKLARLIVKAILDDPVMQGPVDCMLHPAIEPIGFDRIEMRDNVRSLDQSAERKIGFARPLQRAVDTQR